MEQKRTVCTYPVKGDREWAGFTAKNPDAKDTQKSTVLYASLNLA
jgi:hypothetical protein